MLNRNAADADGERGAILVLTALMLAVMIGISALVLDIGYGQAKRRQVQNSADAAALGAAQDLPVITSASGRAASLAATNLPGATVAWSGCSDSGHLAIRSTTSDCISFDSSFTRVRVRIPNQTFPTFFGQVLGITTLSTSASATARVVGVGFGSIQPFALFSGFSSGTACLKQGPSGHRIESCDEPESGNFNLLDVTQYGNETLHTPRNCGNSAQRQRMIDNIAIGSDHAFNVWPVGSPARVDACDIAGPDTIPPRTGNDIDAFDEGMVHGTSSDVSDGGGGRLRRGGYPKATVMGVPLDNKPLWEFIPDTTLPDVPANCQRSFFDSVLEATPTDELHDTMAAALELCFAAYEAGPVPGEGPYEGVLFTANTDPFGKELPLDLYDIQLAPRFTYIPQFVQTEPPSGSSSDLNIREFRAIYINEVFSGCTSRGTCDVSFAPGPWNTGSQGASNDKTEAVTAWVLSPTMLPVGLRGNPSSVGQNSYVQLEE